MHFENIDPKFPGNSLITEKKTKVIDGSEKLRKNIVDFRRENRI